MSPQAMSGIPSEGRDEMSDVSQGDGWWQASDSKWYSPEVRSELPPPPRDIGLSPEGTTRPSVPSPTPPSRTCSAGHEIEEGDRFCAICGKPERIRLKDSSGSSGVNQAMRVVNGQRQESTGSRQSQSTFAIPTAIVLFLVVVVVFTIAVLATTVHHGRSQSYKDGWNTAVDPTQTVDCNNSTAPNGDNQDDWVTGCNDGSNALSGGTTPTTYPSP